MGEWWGVLCGGHRNGSGARRGTGFSGSGSRSLPPFVRSLFDRGDAVSQELNVAIANPIQCRRTHLDDDGAPMIGLYPVQSTSLETGCCGGAENMESQEFEAAAAYALGRLESELSPALSYHSVDHTNADVVPAATRLAADEGIEGNDLRNLVTAAWFHDLGFIEQRTGHEGVGARIASEVLPGFG